VTVKVKRVFPIVVVIQNNLNSLVIFEDKGVGVAAVDYGVLSVSTGGHDGVESWDGRLDVGVVVKEGIVSTISQIVHLEIQYHSPIDLVECG
jgi:hypothetical protein